MPTKASKCSTPYTSNCVGNAKSLQRPVLYPNESDFELAGGVTLHICIDPSTGKVSTGSLWLGRYLYGEKFGFLCSISERVRIDEDRSVWFGSINLEMPWAELIKLADFLHLDIPQPELPAGQEVPR